MSGAGRRTSMLLLLSVKIYSAHPSAHPAPPQVPECFDTPPNFAITGRTWTIFYVPVPGFILLDVGCHPIKMRYSRSNSILGKHLVDRILTPPPGNRKKYMAISYSIKTQPCLVRTWTSHVSPMTMSSCMLQILCSGSSLRTHHGQSHPRAH